MQSNFWLLRWDKGYQIKKLFFDLATIVSGLQQKPEMEIYLGNGSR